MYPSVIPMIRNLINSIVNQSHNFFKTSQTAIKIFQAAGVEVIENTKKF